MKIDSSAKTVGTPQGPACSRASGAQPAATAVKAAEVAQAQPASVLSASLAGVSGSEAPFNSQKVSEIRQAISEGRFQINPEKIADGLISSVREMLAQRNGGAA